MTVARGTPWPPHLSHLTIPRGTSIDVYVEDPLSWHRTGWIRYLIVGWDVDSDRYEAWEPTGFHTRKFTARAAQDALNDQQRNADELKVVATWYDREVLELPLLQGEHAPSRAASTAVATCRDRVFAPRLSGWTPYGPLEMTGPMLFHLHASSYRSICDIGAGIGRLAAWLTGAWDMEVQALDITLPADPEFDVRLFDGRHLPLKDKSVDCAMFTFVLHHCRHFEAQSALLKEAARVSRHRIFVAEDTPASEYERRQTKGHDAKGNFLEVARWRETFKRLQLPIEHEGALWSGSNPSPYFVSRHYFILRVPDWLCPRTLFCDGFGGATYRSGLGACTAFGGSKPCDESLIDKTDARKQVLPDIRERWFSPGVAVDTDRIASWDALQLPPKLCASMRTNGYAQPLPIQQLAVPAALGGADLVCIAQTGSGKTLAFLLPSVLRILSEETPPVKPYFLALAPTRELVLQIAAFAKALVEAPLEERDEATSKKRRQSSQDLDKTIRVAGICGGMDRWEQKRGIYDCAMLAATPGRLLDLLCEAEEHDEYPLSSIQILLLDEGDRMLEEGMEEQLDAVVRRTAAARQTLFFSATWPEPAALLADRFCLQGAPNVLRAKGAEQQSVTGAESREDDYQSRADDAARMMLNGRVKQTIELFDGVESEEVREDRKLARLLELLRSLMDSKAKVLVFCMTKKFADELVDHLWREGVACAAVHGNKTQCERMQHIRDFTSGDTPVIVATGVMSRGLDIPGVTHVLIYDFPGTIEEYCHRIGRTARGADGHGESVAFFEFFPCMPQLPGQLVDLLTRTGQDVPAKLASLAADMSSGVHKQVGQNSHNPFGAKAEGAQAMLAKPAELGDWNADGQRCWNVQISSSSRTTDGWLLLCQGGLLQTHAGDGRWELLGAAASGPPILAVTWNNQSWKLNLKPSWVGMQGNQRYAFWSELDGVELSGVSAGGRTHKYIGD